MKTPEGNTRSRSGNVYLPLAAQSDSVSDIQVNPAVDIHLFPLITSSYLIGEEALIYFINFLTRKGATHFNKHQLLLFPLLYVQS